MGSWRVLGRMIASNQRPVVAVVGTTGVGKSQLAVHLARSLAHRQNDPGPSRAVILSADSMQLYKGLDVITNKVTEEEKGGVEHWGLDVVTMGEGGSWEVGKWCGEASKKIESTPEDTLPIVCGGTHYFIQHFLFPPGELSTERSTSEGVDSTSVRWKPPCPRPPVPADLAPGLVKLLDTFWTAQPEWPNPTETHAGPSSRPTLTEDSQLLALHNLLTAVDTNEAGRWHWRDGRKVRRGLERWWERGGGDVRSEPSSSTEKGRRARFRTLIFWVYEPLPSLAPRLDKRVDKMIENGLLREIAEMRRTALEIYGSPDAVDHTEGIFQSIGYKEFADLDLEQENPSQDPKFANMVALTKSRTYQYARYQLKWIQKQLLPAVREARSLGGEVKVFAVPGGSAGEAAAVEALDAFLSRNPVPDWRRFGHEEAHRVLEKVYDTDIDSKVPDTAERQLLNSRKTCEICSEPGKPFSIASADWELHEKSRIHKSRLKRADGSYERQRAEQMAMRDIKRAEREALRAGRTAAGTEGA